MIKNIPIPTAGVMLGLAALGNLFRLQGFPEEFRWACGIAAGIFGSKAMGGAGGVAFMPQLIMTGMAVAVALTGSIVVYGALKILLGLRLDQEEEYQGADLSIHKITATPEREPNW